MIRLRHKLFIHLLQVFDQIVLVVTAVGIIYYRPDIALHGGTHIRDATFSLQDAIGMILIIAVWIICFDMCVCYKADRLIALKSQIENTAKAGVLASIWLIIVCSLLAVNSFHITNIIIFFVVITLVGISSRCIVHLLLLSARRSGYNFRYLLVVGANERAYQIALKIDGRPELGYKIVGFVAESHEAMKEWDHRNRNDWKSLGILVNIRQVLACERVDEIMVCLPLDSRFSDVARIVKDARDLGIVVRLMSSIEDGAMLKNLHIEELDDEYVVTLFREHMLVQLFLKRIIDTTVSMIMLAVLSPIMATVAVLIKLSSHGPVLFVQNRVGMNQRVFKLYKFRSMVSDAEERKFAIAHLNEQDGPAFKIVNDPRTTRLGRFLRRTSIDELPQLLNVLSGEMSLVGPRPPLPEEVKNYAWLFRKRLSVKPGVTCIWQISGRNNLSFKRWMEMDHEYIENWSLWLDIKILLITIPVVLLSRGAS